MTKRKTENFYYMPSAGLYKEEDLKGAYVEVLFKVGDNEKIKAGDDVHFEITAEYPKRITDVRRKIAGRFQEITLGVIFVEVAGMIESVDIDQIIQFKKFGSAAEFVRHKLISQ